MDDDIVTSIKFYPYVRRMVGVHATTDGNCGVYSVVLHSDVKIRERKEEETMQSSDCYANYVYLKKGAGRIAHTFD